ncbi:hypothetical protein INR49_005337, partial [Caranx melampygus]
MLSSPCFPQPPTQRLTQNTSESKKNRPCTADGNTTQDSHHDSGPLTSLYCLQSSCQPAGRPQSTPQFLQSPRTAQDEGQQHISVIQATGLAASNSPLAQSHREASPLPSRSSPNPMSFSSSPKHLPPSTSPKHLSHSSSPKHSSPHHSKDSFKQTFSLQPSSQNCSDTNLFLNHRPNGAIHSEDQDAPLALISKPHSQSSTPNSKPPLAATSPSYPMPINLSTGTKEPPGSSPSPFKISALSGLAHESESNLESDSDGSDEDMKERGETEADSDTDRTPLKAAKTKLSTHKSCSNLSANSSLLNLQIIKPPSLPSSLLTATPLTSLGAMSNHSTTSHTFATLPGSGRRRRVTDERVLRLPLEFGWQRETRIRTVAGRLQGEVSYFAPCGKKLRQYPDVMKYLLRNGITEISRDNFSFSTKIKVGDFYEAREGPEGLQWFLLAEEQIAPCIIAMDGRRSRRLKSEHQSTADGTRARQLKSHPLSVGENNFQDVNNAKLLRKLEAQEIARQAAQIKLLRKLEKQAMAQAAKEAKKQQAIMAAEERRKKREQMKILKQQEKIKRIQQIRMEKELRAQQILEAKRKKKEEAANARLLEAEKRNKERERRRQHMMLMKAVETRKKAEERERLKKEKKDEKRLNKERKLEIRRLELEKAKELKKPNEDMCLADHKRLPELSRIAGLVLSGSTFPDCLMVLQFLHTFGKVLGLDMNLNDLNLSELQEGLLNIGDSAGKVQDLLSKTSLGDHLTNVEINRDNVSEILQIYMESHCEQTELSALALSLRTKAFQAHSPSQKASMLAFLVNELCCSKAVTRLRNIHAKRTGKRDSSVGGEDSQTCVIPTARGKCKRKEGDSEEEEDEEDDSEDQGDDDEEDEEDSGGKKGKKAETCEEEDDSVHSASVEELEKQIERTYKQQSHIRQKLFDSSLSLRSTMIGQDRYKRCYWVLPHCGGIFVEGMESGEGYEEMEKEKERQETAQVTGIKEEPLEEIKKPTEISHSPPSAHPQQGLTDKADTSVPSLLSAPQLKNSPWVTCSPQSMLHDDQLSKILNEKSSLWFSLLPRSPCDESSVTSGSSRPASSSSPQTINTKSPSSLSPNPLATASYNAPAGINNIQSPVLQQVKSGIHQSRLTLCDVSSAATSPSLPFSGTSLPPVLDLASQHAEGNGNKVLFLVNNNTVNKSDTPEALSDKPPCASLPAVEVAKTQDYPRPQPIPEEMLHGWWRVLNLPELHSLVKALHNRGIREKVLQKQLQKHMEYMTQLCANSKDAVIDVAELEKHEVSEKTVESWCVEEQAMEVDISLLQQVEELERKVMSAGLQGKGWRHPEPQSEQEDLVYYEHKLRSSPPLGNKVRRETSPEQPPGTVVRRPNNPLDIAVSRLTELERNIERSEEEAAPGMRLWHKALREVRSSAQLSLCIQQLQKSIAWERSIMKVESGHSPRSRKQQSRTGGGGKRCSEVKRNSKPSVVGELIKEEAASSNSVPKKGTKEFKKRKRDDSPTSSQTKHDSPVSCVKKGKMAKDNTNGLAMCRVLLAELEAHQDAWPFLTPVNHKAVPGYRKVIKRPMDFSTIREKLTNNQYLNLETFIIDVNLVFDNCEKFNEDDSEIGRAGHNMRRFFDKRWTELLDQSLVRHPVVERLNGLLCRATTAATTTTSPNLKMVSLVCTLRHHTDELSCCAFSPSLLATSSADKTLRVYDTADFSELPYSPLSGHGYGVHCCCFSSCGGFLLSCSTDGSVIVWSSETGEAAAVLQHPGRSPLRVCALAPDSSLLLAGACDGTVSLWDFASRTLRRCSSVSEASVVACCFSPCSQFFVTGCTHGDLKLWDVDISLLHAEKDAHDLGVTCCSSAPQFEVDGCCVEFRLASCGQDSQLKIWIVSQREGAGMPLCPLPQPQTPSLHLRDSVDKSVAIYDANLGTLLNTLKQHDRYVTAVAVSPTMPWIATGSMDRTVNVWRIGDAGSTTAAAESRQPVCQGRKLRGHSGLLVADWSEEDVRTWLCEEGLEELVGCFKANNIDGPELIQLNKETATELGIGSLGLRGRLLRKIEALKAEQSGSEAPDEFLCPITRELMKDPVIAADGYSYERESIESWIRGKNKTSPMTNLPLQTTLLTPNSLPLSDRLLLDARLLVELDTCMLLLLPPACAPTAPHIPSFPVSLWLPWSPAPEQANPSREDAEWADSLSCPTPLELPLQD